MKWIEADLHDMIVWRPESERSEEVGARRIILRAGVDDMLDCLWLPTMFELGPCFHFPRVQRNAEESAVEPNAGAERDSSSRVSPKMMIRARWMLDVEVEIAEEGRMWVLIVHSLEQVESCRFLEL